MTQASPAPPVAPTTVGRSRPLLKAVGATGVFGGFFQLGWNPAFAIPLLACGVGAFWAGSEPRPDSKQLVAALVIGALVLVATLPMFRADRDHRAFAVAVDRLRDRWPDVECVRYTGGTNLSARFASEADRDAFIGAFVREVSDWCPEGRARGLCRPCRVAGAPGTTPR